MANWMLPPLAMAREFCLMLPSGTTVEVSEEIAELGRDTIVAFTVMGKRRRFLVTQHDRLLSLEALAAKYKPVIDDLLVSTWSVEAA